MKLKQPAGPLCSDDRPLIYDEACITFENLLRDTASLYKVYSNCYKCKLSFWANVKQNDSMSLIVHIHSSLRFVYLTDMDTEIKSCALDYHFGQHGMYKFVMDYSCDGIEIVTPPDSPYTSMYLFLIILILLWIAFIIFDRNKLKSTVYAFIALKLRRKNEENTNGEEKGNLEEYELTQTHSETETSTKDRYYEQAETQNAVEFISRGTNTDYITTEVDKTTPLISKKQLPESDVLLSLRGLMVTTYIFLIVEGGTYFFFRKSIWNGFRLLDICRGFLYWVLSASVYLRLRNSLVNGENKKTVFLRQVLLRSLIYVIVGLLYNKVNGTRPSNHVPDLRLRIFGVFQRFGMSSFVIFALEVGFMKMHIKKGPFFQDIIDCWPQLMTGVLFAVLHTCVTFLLPVPGCPTGYTGPGGLADYGEAEYCTGGAAGYIDRTIFPRILLNRVKYWEFKEDMQTYDVKIPFDQEGLLGTLNTCFLMALAVHASRICIYFQHPLGRTIRLLFWSFCQIFIGLMLTNFSANEGLVPPNVYLMSLSYVMQISGLCYFLFLCFYLLIDVWHIWSGLPFIYTGANILVVYIGGKLLQHMFPFEWGYDKEDIEDNSLCLIKALWSVIIWILVCYYLFQKNIICPV